MRLRIPSPIINAFPIYGLYIKSEVSLRVCIIFRIFVENQNMQVYGNRNQ